MGTENQRKILMQRILHSIRTASLQDIPVVRLKLEALICLENGLTKRKATEYVQTLIDAGSVKDNNGELWIKSLDLIQNETNEHTSI
jgi:hypothetical protein